MTLTDTLDFKQPATLNPRKTNMSTRSPFAMACPMLIVGLVFLASILLTCEKSISAKLGYNFQAEALGMLHVADVKTKGDQHFSISNRIHLGKYVLVLMKCAYLQFQQDMTSENAMVESQIDEIVIFADEDSFLSCFQAKYISKFHDEGLQFVEHRRFPFGLLEVAVTDFISKFNWPNSVSHFWVGNPRIAWDWSDSV